MCLVNPRRNFWGWNG